MGSCNCISTTNISYAYDALGQLIRVNDETDTTSGAAGTTWTYEYDRGGNIISKSRYAYTTGPLGTALETIVYGYGDYDWMDKLTHYNYIGISYDAIGNPTSYNGWHYTWEKGRQLTKMTDNVVDTITFKYNADGLRVQKRKVTTYGLDVTTNYILHGKNIVHMTQGTNVLHFWYDAQGRPAIVEYNGVKYAYIHNLQGDIVGIIDSNGNEVVQYTYDAWGKVLSTAGTMASTLGTVQPFRYRGYVYDVETGLYYLRSRYYDPVWGRFINADALVKGNLFAYCNNNPIARFDDDGNTNENINALFPYNSLYVSFFEFPETINPCYTTQDKVEYLFMNLKATEAYIIEDYFNQHEALDFFKDHVFDTSTDILIDIGTKVAGDIVSKIAEPMQFLKFLVDAKKQMDKAIEKKMFSNAYYSAKTQNSGVVIKKITTISLTYEWNQASLCNRWITRSSSRYEYFELNSFLEETSLEDIIKYASIH